MDLTDEGKVYIDNLTYEEMLRRWRFGAMGDSIFQGDSGKYWIKVMEEKRQRVDHVKISKMLGWGDQHYAV